MIIVNVNWPVCLTLSCIKACCYLLGGDSGQCAPGIAAWVASYMYRICLFTNSADTSLRYQILHACNPPVSSSFALRCVMNNKLQFSLYILAHLVMCSILRLEIPFLLQVRSWILVAQRLHLILPLLVARMKAIFCAGHVWPKSLMLASEMHSNAFQCIAQPNTTFA